MTGVRGTVRQVIAEISKTSFVVRGAGFLNVIVRDVTRRRHGENELRQLAAAVRNAPDAISMLDLSGRCNYINPAYTK